MQWRQAPVTVAITAVTLIVSVLILLVGWLPEAALGAGMIPARFGGALLPPELGFVFPAWLTPISATFVHGGAAHVAFNLVMLAYCGVQTERPLGGIGIAILYVVGAYAAAAGQWILSPMSTSPMIGASGAISAIVAAYALLYGERRAQAWGPVPGGVMHVAWLAAAWIGIQALIGFAGLGAGGPIAVGAHIGGFIAGLVLARPLLLWHYRHA